MEHGFTAEIMLLEGKIRWSVVYFPHPASESFGTNGRVNVRVSVDGHGFDAVLLPSRNGHYFAFNATMKKATGKKLGDKVSVTLEKAEARRELAIPGYISAALTEHALLDKLLAMPYYIAREEISKIDLAAREETRTKRLESLIAKLKG